VTKQTAAGDQKIPSLHPIGSVIGSAEAGFVIADDLVQGIVQGHGVGRDGIMKVEDRHGAMRVGHFGAVVGDI